MSWTVVDLGARGVHVLPPGWMLIELGDDVHTLPEGGDEYHRPTAQCWCSPDVLTRPTHLIVCHRSARAHLHDEERRNERQPDVPDDPAR